MTNITRSFLIVAVLLVGGVIITYKETTGSLSDTRVTATSTSEVSSSSTEQYKEESGQPNQPETPQQGTCYIGGCSGQLCGDEPDMMSTCEYKEEYSCYKDARCERQSSGACGWTETQELKICLSGKVLIQ